MYSQEMVRSYARAVREEIGLSDEDIQRRVASIRPEQTLDGRRPKPAAIDDQVEETADEQLASFIFDRSLVARATALKEGKRPVDPPRFTQTIDPDLEEQLDDEALAASIFALTAEGRKGSAGKIPGVDLEGALDELEPDAGAADPAGDASDDELAAQMFEMAKGGKN